MAEDVNTCQDDVYIWYVSLLSWLNWLNMASVLRLTMPVSVCHAPKPKN